MKLIFYIFMALLILSAPVQALNSSTVITDDGTPGSSTSSVNNTRIYSTTFRNVNIDINQYDQLNISTMMDIYSAGPDYVNIEIGITNDNKTITGYSYNITKQITSSSPEWIWINISNATEKFTDGDLIIRMVGNATCNWVFWVDIAADNSTLKNNQYWNEVGWLDKTNDWIYFTRLYAYQTYEDATPVISNTNLVNTSYENTDQLFTLDIDQTVNVSWKINGTVYQTNISATSASYINSTALNGSFNVTAIVTNANGTDSHSWTMTRLLPTWNNIVDESNSTYIRFTLSNYTEGVQINSVIWGNQTNGTNSTYTLKWYSNDTVLATNSTVVNNNVTLFYDNIPEGTYYIKETTTTTIETFVVAVGAFAAVVVAGAAVVSRRVRRGISGFWNRRIRRR